MTFGDLFPPGRVAAIAHRGGSKLRPENTLEAFDHAVSLGVDALECDVHVSSDEVPVIIHDATLERTTDASGPVAAKSADELRHVDAGARFGTDAHRPFQGQGIGVPRLVELLDRHRDIPVIVEIKGDRPEVVPSIVDVLRQSPRPDRFVVGGFSHAVLSAVRQLAPEYPTSASKVEVEAAIRRAYLRIRPRRTGFAVFQVPYRFQGRQIFARPFVRTVTRAGIPFQSWIIDEEEDMHRLMDWGVTGLISDRPDVAVRVARNETASAMARMRTESQ